MPTGSADDGSPPADSGTDGLLFHPLADQLSVAELAGLACEAYQFPSPQKVCKVNRVLQKVGLSGRNGLTLKLEPRAVAYSLREGQERER